MKGSAITGPVGKEAAELWPVSVFLKLKDGFSINMHSSSVLPATPVSSCKEACFFITKGRDFFLFSHLQREKKR